SPMEREADSVTPRIAIPDERTRPRVIIVTNGNYFANLALGPLLKRTRDRYHYQVVVTTGLRRPSGNRAQEALRLLRRWGLRYAVYKAATYALPSMVQAVTRRALFVRRTCEELDIPVHVVRNVNEEGPTQLIRGFGPDLLVSHSCPYRIRAHVLAIPGIGALNVHSSLLPEYAGVSTYIHVLAHGQTRTGVTVHEMVEEFDAGRILEQQVIEMPPRTSAFALFSEQSVVAGRLLALALDRCVAARRVEGNQQELERRSYFGDPTSQDIADLRRRGHRLLRVSDLSRLLRSAPQERLAQDAWAASA
ncbi:MAG TPA: formyltransferase family protein, partial [bacterium]|nr:formyltransferase family protein [bacterium]